MNIKVSHITSLVNILSLTMLVIYLKKIHKNYNVPKLENSRWRRMPSLCTIDVIDIL